MAKLLFHTIELSDIKKIVEEAIDKKLNSITASPKDEAKLYTRKETANFLKISLPTLHDWTKSGVVKADRIGNRVLYKYEEIAQALNQIQTSKMRGGYNG